jgi:hypothetical protein
MASVMHSVVLFVVWMIVFTATVTVLGCSMAVRSVRRANRVHPDRRSAAPLRWLYSLREPARLHRRLRRAVSLARSAVAAQQPPAHRRRKADEGGALSGMADELAQRAAAIDDQLVWAASIHRRWRRQTMLSLAREVADVETGAWRLARLAQVWRAQLHQAALVESSPPLDLGSRLDAFEAAMAELSRVSPAH